MQALSFYGWKDHVNFVFPFVEYNLEDLLSGEWEGPSGFKETPKTPKHRLWVQMIGVAGALETIHNPKNQKLHSPDNENSDMHNTVSRGMQKMSLERHDRRIVGFHFDLKPANILVTDDGKLKISDFGLSLIKEVNPGSASYGLFRGGALSYLAPELSPSDELGRISPGVTQTKSFRTIPDEFKNKCDVWSYACVALEVFLYLFKDDGQGELENFRTSLDSEGQGSAFHASDTLKLCVKAKLEQLSNHDSARPERSEYRAWTAGIKACLEGMLEIQPKDRLSSGEVVEKLRTIGNKFDELPDDNLRQQLVRFEDREYPEEMFDRVYYRPVPDSRKLFLQMSVFTTLTTIFESSCAFQLIPLQGRGFLQLAKRWRQRVIWLSTQYLV